MKRINVIFLLFIINISLFAEDKILDYALLIGKPVPKDYIRMDSKNYAKYFDTYTVILSVEENLVTLCSIGSSFDTLHEANIWFSEYFNYLKNTNWNNYLTEKNGDERFEKDDFNIHLDKPVIKRVDNKITVGIYIFKKRTKDVSDFNIISWIEKYSQYIGQTNRNPNNKMYLIDSFIMKYGSKCTFNAVNEKNIINSVGLVITNENYNEDFSIFYDQLFDYIKKGIFKISGELEDEFIVEYKNLKFIITQPKKTMIEEDTFIIMFLIYKK